MRPTAFFAVCLILACPCARAQSWDHVKALPPGQNIRVNAAGHASTCTFRFADDETLHCESHRHNFFHPGSGDVYPRSAVREIKLSRQALSTVTGAAIGAGAGAGIGAGIDASEKSGEDPHLAAGLFGVLGGLFGTIVGAHTDFLARPTIYRAPPNP